MNKKPENTSSLLKNNWFRKTIFAVLIFTTVIVNLDYIQPRDSSKADLFPSNSNSPLRSSLRLTYA